MISGRSTASITIMPFATCPHHACNQQHTRPSTQDPAPTTQHPRPTTNTQHRPSTRAIQLRQGARHKGNKSAGISVTLCPIHQYAREVLGRCFRREGAPTEKRHDARCVCVGKAGLSGQHHGGEGRKGDRSRARRRVSGLPTCPYIVMTSLWGNEKMDDLRRGGGGENLG